MSAPTTQAQMVIPNETIPRIIEQQQQQPSLQPAMSLRGGGCVKDCLIACCVCCAIEDICCCEIDDICC